MRRIPIETVADPNQRSLQLEGHNSELLPSDKVYVDPVSGKTFSGKQGHRMKDLPPNAIETPKVHCYEAN